MPFELVLRMKNSINNKHVSIVTIVQIVVQKSGGNGTVCMILTRFAHYVQFENWQVAFQFLYHYQMSFITRLSLTT